jgi:hypothetical protein
MDELLQSSPRIRRMNNQFPMSAWRARSDRIEAAKTVDMPLRLDNAKRVAHIPIADAKAAGSCLI